MYRPLPSYLTIKSSKIDGLGLFATENIKESTSLGISHVSDRWFSGGYISGISGHVCNVDYIGRTKVTGYTFVLNKRINVEINLKQVKFV